MNTTTSPRELYYYGLPGEEYDQALFSTKFSNTRDIILTHSSKNIIEEPTMYIHNPMSISMDLEGKDQIMKLIEHCRIKNN